MLIRVYFEAGGRAVEPLQKLKLWIIKFVSRAPIYHVAVGFRGVVLNPTMAGVVYHVQDDYESMTPTLAASADVQTSTEIDLGRWEKYAGVQIDYWPPFKRWLLRGRCPLVYDCLCIALSCLQDAGLDPPRTITTPAKLLAWLRSEGFPCR